MEICLVVAARSFPKFHGLLEEGVNESDSEQPLLAEISALQ